MIKSVFQNDLLAPGHMACPGCGASIPICRASASIRPGSRRPASSSLSVRFSSTSRSRIEYAILCPSGAHAESDVATRKGESGTTPRSRMPPSRDVRGNHGHD